MRGEPTQGLVDGVVDHLIDHVVQAGAVIGVADIHPGAFAHRLEPLEDLDRVCAVDAVRFFRFVGHSSFHDGQARSFDPDAQGATLDGLEEGIVGARKKGLKRESVDFIKKRRPPRRIEVCGDLVE